MVSDKLPFMTTKVETVVSIYCACVLFQEKIYR